MDIKAADAAISAISKAHVIKGDEKYINKTYIYNKKKSPIHYSMNRTL